MIIESVSKFASIIDIGVKTDPNPRPNDNPYITVDFFFLIILKFNIFNFNIF